MKGLCESTEVLKGKEVSKSVFMKVLIVTAVFTFLHPSWAARAFPAILNTKQEEL